MVFTVIRFYTEAIGLLFTIQYKNREKYRLCCLMRATFYSTNSSNLLKHDLRAIFLHSLRNIPIKRYENRKYLSK